MINKTKYQEINCQNLSRQESDRKWKLFEQEQAIFNLQNSPFSPMGGVVEEYHCQQLQNQ